MTTAERSYLIAMEKGFRDKSEKQHFKERAITFEICAELVRQIINDFEEMRSEIDEQTTS